MTQKPDVFTVEKFDNLHSKKSFFCHWSNGKELRWIPTKKTMPKSKRSGYKSRRKKGKLKSRELTLKEEGQQ